MLSIYIIERVLTDKSRVYDVHVGAEIFPACSERDARDCAEKIRRAVLDHTTTDPRVVFLPASRRHK